MNGNTINYGKRIKEKILNNSLVDKKSNLVGTYKHFNINIEMLASEPQTIVVINAKNETDLNNVNLNNWLRSNIINLKDVINIGANPNNVVLVIKTPLFGNKLPEIINYNVEYVIDYLASSGYETCCSKCGSINDSTNCYQINSNYIYLCNSCMLKTEQTFKQNKIQKQKVEPDILRGVIGAIIGALFGILIWLIIYKLGFIASIGGIAISYGVLFGFEKLGKNLNKNSIIICIIMMMVTVWLANRMAWTLSAYTDLKDEYSFIECFINLGKLLEYNGYTRNYIGELIVGYILTLVGSLKTIINILKNVNGDYTIKKVEH